MGAIAPSPQSSYQMREPNRKTLILLGAGGHASVVADAARESDFVLAGFAAPDSSRAPGLGDLAYFGDDQALAARLTTGGLDAVALVIAFGGVDATSVRRRTAERFALARFATIVHRMAWVSQSATIAEGSVVAAGAVVNAGASIGLHCIVNSGAIVEHDASLGDFVQLSPGAIIGGGARVADGAFVGLGATIRDHVNVGADAVIGMGAVVVSDVAADTVVTGSPARPMSDASRPS